MKGHLKFRLEFLKAHIFIFEMYLGVDVSAGLPIQPLAMQILDSLSVHSKMSLLHHIVTHILKLVIYFHDL